MNNLVSYTFSFVNSSTLKCYKLGIFRVQLKQFGAQSKADKVYIQNMLTHLSLASLSGT